jgi:ESF2/ABP1 family protein
MEKLAECIYSKKASYWHSSRDSTLQFHAIDPKRAYLRKKHTTSKKPHYTEGWVEFKSKKIARSVADMLNARPIGGKKGTRWAEDVWTMKYLPRFKWYMLTEQIGESLYSYSISLY